MHRKDEDGISECAPDRGAELSSNVTISASEDRTSEKEHANKLIFKKEEYLVLQGGRLDHGSGRLS